MSFTHGQDGSTRVGGVADREALWRLINDAFGVERRIKKGGGDRLVAGSRELDDLLERGTFLVMEEAGTLLACVYVEARGDRCYLGLLSVAPRAQGRGLGRSMMDAAESGAFVGMRMDGFARGECTAGEFGSAVPAVRFSGGGCAGVSGGVGGDDGEARAFCLDGEAAGLMLATSGLPRGRKQRLCRCQTAGCRGALTNPSLRSGNVPVEARPYERWAPGSVAG